MAEKESGAQQKIAPARNEPKKPVLSRNSRALELQGRDPEYHYEFLSTDPKHPSFIEHKLNEYEIGDHLSGYAVVEGWEVVHRNTDRKVAQVEARTDQGKPVDTTIKHGSQVLCRIRKSEYEKHRLVEQARQTALEDQIYSPERQGDGQAFMTAVVSRDEATDRTQLLRQAGHPMPGIS